MGYRLKVKKRMKNGITKAIPFHDFLVFCIVPPNKGPDFSGPIKTNLTD
jgi:hypothetical protein